MKLGVLGVLAVNPNQHQEAGMNRVFVVGNITGNIYFDRFLMKSERRSFLRLLLMASRPRPLRGLRVVLWDEKAELYYPYLKKGSELAVIGQFETRSHRGKLIHEVVSESLLLLRNIDWERGEALRRQYHLPAPNGAGNHVFVVGEVLEGMAFDLLQRSPARGGGEYACLRLRLRSDEYLDGLRVTVRGALAELAHPYLQTGARIAVDGALQTRLREQDGNERSQSPVASVEVTAHNLTFLENINWAAGEAARRPAANRATESHVDHELAGMLSLPEEAHGD
jgi:single-stranded DNA-binding protein